MLNPAEIKTYILPGGEVGEICISATYSRTSHLNMGGNVAQSPDIDPLIQEAKKQVRDLVWFHFYGELALEVIVLERMAMQKPTPDNQRRLIERLQSLANKLTSPSYQKPQTPN